MGNSRPLDSQNAGHPRTSRRRMLGYAGTVGATGVGAMLLGTPDAAAQVQTRSNSPAAAGTISGMVLVNNVGYETAGAKRALVTGVGRAGDRFDLIDTTSGKSAYRGKLAKGGSVEDWSTTSYLIADFDGFKAAGAYVLKVADTVSTQFRVEDTVLERRTVADVVHYFKGSRSTGQFDKRDSAIPSKTDPSSRYDVRGGWYDATGDFGKHAWLHRTVWVLFKAYDQLTARRDANFTQLRTWLLDEAMFGADYLVRIHPSKGSFYNGVSQPGPPKDPKLRTLDTTQVVYGDNSGYAGGMDAGYAIAGLALAATYDVSGEFTTADYISAAEEAYDYLEGVPLADEVTAECDALTAAAELFRATGKTRYRVKAASMTEKLIGRLAKWKSYQGYWSQDANGRPYCDGTDGGRPVVALLSYLDIAPSAERQKILDAVRTSLTYELAITEEVRNPFGYARQLVEDAKGNRRSGYFLPHDIHGRSKDMWWQGENARLGSMATAARFAAPYFAASPDFAKKLRAYAANQLNWILGTNPFAACMLAGSGLNTPQYDWLGSWQFLPYAGGICNGITGANDDGSGIAWNQGYAVTGKDDDWRWQEQWLPHASWFLYAVCIGERSSAVLSLAKAGVRGLRTQKVR